MCICQKCHIAEGSGIRLGLTAIKHVGAAAARLVVDGRQGSPYQNLQDFRRRVKLPDHTVQALVQGGAFDSLGKRMDLCAQLGIGVSDGLSMLKAERELIGTYSPTIRLLDSRHSSAKSAAD